MDETVKLPKVEVVPIDSITPYFNNPRVISDEAVSAVKESIERFDYQQPIVVDADGVVIVGHTRLRALVELGRTEVAVVRSTLPAEKVREYRLVDNKVAEMGFWDFEALVVELREWETGLLETYFPEIDLGITEMVDEQVSQDQIDWAVEEIQTVKPPREILKTRVECPACEKQFVVATESLPGLTRGDIERLMEDGTSK